MWRKIGRLLGIAILLSAMGIAAAALYTQYVFQESFHVTWSRLLKPELDWQRSKYPSLEPGFKIADRLLSAPDPRKIFGEIQGGNALARPAIWSHPAVGPRIETVATSDVPGLNETIVSRAQDLIAAIRNATPGETITIVPGKYPLSARSINVTSAGSKSAPITLRAKKLGTVTLLLNTLEGFHIRGSDWVFENLVINGVCEKHASCEHAFHIVGDAHRTVIRNNRISNFNAALKVNGADGRFPDDGRVANNVFINDTPRQTTRPVTLLDIVGASNWIVEGNFVADFAKAQGDGISYGAFFKGGGTGNIFERNLVRCERRHRGGTRIGISFGGGGTDRNGCRDGRCRNEQAGGVARNNIVMNCPNDVGIYLNKSADTRIHNNLLIDTRGIDVRFPETAATIRNNVIDGRIRARDGGRYIENGNVMSVFQAALNGDVTDSIFLDPRVGDLSLIDEDTLKNEGADIKDRGPDFCNRRVPNSHRHIGPFILDGKQPCLSRVP